MIGSRPLDRNERRAVLNLAEPRERALLAIGFASGFRISELLSLRIGDVVGPNGAVLRFIRVKAGNTKTRTGRTVPMGAGAAQAILALTKRLLAQGQTLDSPLFTGRKSRVKAISRIQAWKLLQALFAKAGVFGGTLGTHTMRKTFAADMYAALNGQIEKVMIALGHKSIQSTLSYLSFRHNEVTDAITNLTW